METSAANIIYVAALRLASKLHNAAMFEIILYLNSLAKTDNS